MDIHCEEFNSIGYFRTSVIIPAYNAGSYLSEAISSIMAQTIKPYEVILIDDGSTDASAQQAIQSFPSVRYFRQENAGTGAARNKGVEVAQGNFFAFLDADDLWLENKMEIQMKAFAENLDIEAVFGHVKNFFSPDLDEESRGRLFCPEEPMPGCLPATMLIKRESFFRVGMFETNWRVGQEVSWILRARELGIKTLMLPDLIYMRRLHKNNKGITHRQFINDRVRIIKAHLDSKRKNSEHI
jgi:glycosyltransferase involved in cell wall biosynthesis